MSKITTGAIAAFGLIAAAFTPLAAEAKAAVTVFSGSEAFVQVFYNYYDDSGNYWDINVGAFENASKSKSVKGISSGAIVWGSAWDGTYFYFLNGDTTSITFKAEGALPKNVTASGSIPVIVTTCDWSFENCTDSSDTVTFNLNADALRDQAESRSGVEHWKYLIFKTSLTYDRNYVPAVFSDDSSIVSPFGISIPDELNSIGSVGYAKSHLLDINWGGGI
ncbi:MAG: hypothetical protein ACXWTH_02955 [Methylosarcina sp.]